MGRGEFLYGDDFAGKTSWALGFGLSFPVRRGPYGPTGCLSGEARLRRTGPRGWGGEGTPTIVGSLSRTCLC